MGVIEDIASLFTRLRLAEKGVQSTWDYAVSILERAEAKFGELYGRLANIEKAVGELNTSIKQLSGLDVQGFIGKAISQVSEWTQEELNALWTQFSRDVGRLDDMALGLGSDIGKLLDRVQKTEEALAYFTVHVFDGLASYFSTNVETIGQALRSVEIPASWNPVSEPHQKIRAQLAEYRKNWR